MGLKQASNVSGAASGSQRVCWHSSRCRCRSSRRWVNCRRPRCPTRLGTRMRCLSGRRGRHPSICCGGRRFGRNRRARCYRFHLGLRGPISSGLMRGAPTAGRTDGDLPNDAHTAVEMRRRREDVNGRKRDGPDAELNNSNGPLDEWDRRARCLT